MACFMDWRSIVNLVVRAVVRSCQNVFMYFSEGLALLRWCHGLTVDAYNST